MPRYFFNVHDGSEYLDDQGIRLPNLEAARRHAIRLSGDLLRDHADLFWDGEEWKMDVTNDVDLILFTLIFHAIDAPAAMRLPWPDDTLSPDGLRRERPGESRRDFHARRAAEERWIAGNTTSRLQRNLHTELGELHEIAAVTVGEP